MSQIYELMPRIISDVGAIPKSKKNNAMNYKFRGIDDVLNAVHPVLVKHGVSLSTQCQEYKSEVVKEKKVRVVPGAKAIEEEKNIYRASLYLAVHFYAPDGSCVAVGAYGEGLDYGGDKATSKAMSAAFKYALFLGLCIPLDESDIDDGDRTSAPEQVSRRVVEQSQAQAEGAKTEPAAETQPAQPEQQPAKTINATGPKQADGDSTTCKETDLCTDQQRSQVVDLAKALGMDKPALQGILKKRGVETTRQLTISQADDLIAAMKRRAMEKEAESLFPNGGQS